MMARWLGVSLSLCMRTLHYGRLEHHYSWMVSSFRLRPGTDLGFGHCSMGRVSIHGGYGTRLSWGTATEPKRGCPPSLGSTRRGAHIIRCGQAVVGKCGLRVLSLPLAW